MHHALEAAESKCMKLTNQFSEFGFHMNTYKGEKN